MQWQYEASTDVKLQNEQKAALNDFFFIQSFLKSYAISVWETEL